MVRKLTLALVALALSFPVYAQRSAELSDAPKNTVKLNLFSLPLRSFSLQYERGFNGKMSAALGFRLMPKGALPLQGTIKNLTDADEEGADDAGLDFINSAQISNWAITPEFRYYFGKKAYNGFYVAPFLRIGGYGIDWNYKFETDGGADKPVHFKGRSASFAGGILLGAQWHLGKHFLLDWWIIGPHYGSNNISLEASGDFSDWTPEEQQELENALEDISLGSSSFDASVNDNGAKAESSISLPGLRTGFCIGYTF